MAEITQIPAELDIEVTQGDDWSMLIDADIDLTGYTFASKVEEVDGTSTDITVTETDLSAGQVTLSLTDTETDALSVINHKWYFDWTVSGATRRVLAGKYTIITYP